MKLKNAIYFILMSCFFLIISIQKVKSQITTAAIAGSVDKELEGETIKLLLWDHYLAGDLILGPTIYTAVVQNGKFKIQFPVKFKIQYFKIEGLQNKVWSSSKPFLTEPADDIFINETSNNIYFSGQGSGKFRFRMEMEHKLMHDPQAPKLPEFLTKINITENIKINSDLQIYQKAILNKYQNQLSTNVYNLLKIDILSFLERMKNNSVTWFFNWDSLTRLESLKIYERELLNTSFNLIDNIPVEYLGMSAEYPVFMFKKLADESYYNFIKSPHNSVEYLSWFRSKDTLLLNRIKDFKGLLRDKMLFQYMNRIKNRSSQLVLEKSLYEALAINTTASLQEIYKDWVKRFGKGEKVFNFSLTDTAGNTVQLSDFKNKVVFLDMWFTGCGACKYVAEAMPEVEEVFKSNNEVVFLSISVDKNKDVWLASIRKDAKNNDKYYHAGNYYSGQQTIYLYTGGRGTEDPFIEKYVTSGYPTLLLIDKNGSIFSSNPPRPRKGRTAALITEINEAISN